MGDEDYTTSLRKWFDKFTKATGQTPDCIVFGDHSFYGSRTELWDDIPTFYVVISFDDVPAAVLDRTFPDGFGGNDAPDFCAWSESWVIFCDNYDGAEDVQWVPRHPTNHHPIRPGGG